MDLRQARCRFALLTAFSLLLTACASASPQAASAGAAQVVLDYLKARVAGDVDAMVRMSCADWEAGARREAASLRNISATLENAACTVSDQQGDRTFVACTGKIVANYNGELRDLDLAGRQFALVQQGGEWLVCGYRQE
ncbi:MAG: hypothetical protein RMM31_09535 [Anaerolineae bacterium]|nr:hypothetical protein [Thermoflexales bacterium]MDW8396469.1 hypothetical protein [Anaerolineae bacterium]